MTRLSLRLRLILAGAVAVGLALTLAAFGLGALFATHVERRAVAELTVTLDQVMAGLGRDAAGDLTLATPPADPRFALPYGGLYWQIETPNGLLRSRSLWDRDLALPQDVLSDGEIHVHRLTGPNGQALLVLERAVRLPRSLGQTTVRAAVALDRAELNAARRAFLTDLAPYLGVLAAVLIGAGAAQVAIGLRPLVRLGRRVTDLRRGAADRMGEDWPREVRPLAAEIDALLTARAADVDRARTRAGDLAHGLKTPLQALLGVAERLRRRQEEAAAADIDTVVRTMQRHVDRELIRARTLQRSRLGGDRARSDLQRTLQRVLAVLTRMPEGAALAWHVAPETAATVALDDADLAEALGALLENAARHARSRVSVDALAEGAILHVAIRDDGPGIPAADRDRLLARGARLDEAGPGTGLGLAIASEIVEAAGGSLTLGDAAPGLAVHLTLPLAPDRQTGSSGAGKASSGAAGDRGTASTAATSGTSLPPTAAS